LYGAGHFELGGGLSLESRLGYSRRLFLFGGVGNSVCHWCVVSVMGVVSCTNMCMCCICMRGVPDGLGESVIVVFCRYAYICVYDIYSVSPLNFALLMGVGTSVCHL